MDNNEDHYKKIIDITRPLSNKPHHIDYADCSRLADAIDDVMSISQKNFNLHINLYEELFDMNCALASEHGLDYGTNINWKNYAQQLITIFPNGYIKNTDNLKILFNFIKDAVMRERE